MIEIYIKIGAEYKRIDLFKDETISLTSSIQNINDLSKVYTDFTQTFTIPASKNNQIIFNYWNENAVNDGFDHRIRYDSILEINTMPFRRGKIQIEKANEKNNSLESFSITFYGSTKQLKDLFKEEELSILDYSTINHEYNFSNVIGRVNGSISSDVRYPIINSSGRYEYLSGTTNDITVGGMLSQSVVYTDLFPAIKVSKIIEFIENRYGINFGGFFLNTSYFTELFLYCKNNEFIQPYTTPSIIPFTSQSGDTFSQVNQTDNTFTFADTLDYLTLEISLVPSGSFPYRLIVKNNGITINVFENLLGNQTVIVYNYYQNTSFGSVYSFEVESSIGMTFGTGLNIFTQFFDGIDFINNTGSYSGTLSTINNINIQNYVPKIKIIDFITGLIKMFNLTIIPTTENNFELQPLELFYGYGKYIDINPFAINDNTDIERPKLFKKITFAHEKSENILNNAFRNLFNRDYGDLNFEDQLSNESSNYEIKSPFEDIMYEKTTGYDFITASLIDKDLNAYKPKPILMYLTNTVTLPTNIKFYNGSTYVSESTYLKFTNELIINNEITSLNWGEEQSINIPTSLASNSLFALWYKNYIGQLYNIRTRLVRLKALIPQTILTDIKLNDKIIYKDKKYIINNFTTNLTTNEIDFELITDFRPVQETFALQTEFRLSAEEQPLEVSLLIGTYDGFTATYNGTPIFGSVVRSDINATITVAENTTSDYLRTQIEIEYFKGSTSTFRYIDITQNP